MRLFWTLARQISPTAGGQNPWLTIVTLIIRIIIIINFIIVIIPSTTRAWIQNILSAGKRAICVYRILSAVENRYSRIPQSGRVYWKGGVSPLMAFLLRSMPATTFRICCISIALLQLVDERGKLFIMPPQTICLEIVFLPIYNIRKC